MFGRCSAGISGAEEIFAAAAGNTLEGAYWGAASCAPLWLFSAAPSEASALQLP